MNHKSKLTLFLTLIITILFLFVAFSPIVNPSIQGKQSNGTNQFFKKSHVNSDSNLFSDISVYSVAFAESGLPSGTTWWVELGGNTVTSTSSTITFNEPNGTYNYLVDTSAPSGTQYTVSSSSGTIYVQGFAYPTTDIFYTVEYYLSVNADPSSYGTVSPSSGWYYAGETWTLFETPDYGYGFLSWSGSGSGSYSGTSSSPMITMNGPITETAYFTQESYPVTFTESGLPSGTTWWVNIGGVNLSSTSSSIIFNLPDGTYDYTVMDTSSNGVQYQTTSSGIAVVAGYSVVQDVYYTVNYYLTVLSSPTSSGTITPVSGWYQAGYFEFLSAIPNTGYQLSYWSGSGSGSYSGTSSSPMITMNGPITETAYFVKPKYGVTFQESGLPAGKVWWVSIEGKNASSTSSSITFNLSDGTYSYTVMDQENNWAKYIPGSSTGSVTVFGPGITQYVYYTTSYYGGVYADPQVYGNVTPTSGWFYAGNYVFLTEIQNSGFAFSSWSGNGTGSYTGTSSSPSFIVNGPFNETAHFYQPKYEVSFTESGLPSGTTWWVNLDSGNYSSNSSTITLKLPDGTYDYRIGQNTPSGAKYSPGYSTGLVTVFGSSVTQDVYYSIQYYLNMTNSPSVGGSSSPSSGWYYSDTQLSLLTYPANGYLFSSWIGTGKGSYSGKDANPMIEMDGPVNETAHYMPVYKITFKENGLTGVSSFSVDLNGTSKVSFNGQVSFTLLEGNYSYSIGNVTGFRPSIENGIIHVLNSSQELDVNFTEILYPVTFKESGLQTGQLWSVELSNGTVYSSSGNEISLSLADGLYDYNISAKNEYVITPVIEILDIYGSPAQVNVSFKEYPQIRVNVGTPGASLSINGIADSTQGGIYQSYLSPSFYYINVTMAGYLPYSNLVYLEAGKAYYYNVTLEKLNQFGYLEGSVTPYTATVMAGSSVIPVSGGHYDTSLSPGTYFISYTAPDYISLVREVNISMGNVVYLNVSLQRAQTTATLYGHVSPGNASLVVNGFVAYVNSTGFYHISIPDGSYHISVYSKGYFPYSVNVLLFSLTMMNFSLVKEPPANSTFDAGAAKADGFNVTLSNLKTGQGFISIDYTSRGNGSMVISIPFKMLSNVTMSDILNSTVYIDNLTYSNFTISISSNYSILLKVYGLSKGDPTLYWKYQPSAVIPKYPTGNNPFQTSYILALIGIMAVIFASTGVYFWRRRK